MCSPHHAEKAKMLAALIPACQRIPASIATLLAHADEARYMDAEDGNDPNDDNSHTSMVTKDLLVTLMASVDRDLAEARVKGAEEFFNANREEGAEYEYEIDFGVERSLEVSKAMLVELIISSAIALAVANGQSAGGLLLEIGASEPEGLTENAVELLNSLKAHKLGETADEELEQLDLDIESLLSEIADLPETDEPEH